MILDAATQEMDGIILEFIIRYDPNRSRQAVVSLASHFVSDVIIQQFIKGDTEKLKDWHRFSLRSRLVSGRTIEWILYAAFHRSLLRKGQWPVMELEQKWVREQCHWCSVWPTPVASQYMISDSQAEDASIRSIPQPNQQFSVILLDVYDMDMPLSLHRGMGYYRSAECNQREASDGSLRSGNARGLAVVFQATVNCDRKVKRSGFDWLLGLSDVKEVWYVAVTPEDLRLRFAVDE